jgi:hypothetical protein
MNMKKFIIRAVDSGNIQRSPTFQAVFNYTISMTDDYPVQLSFDSGGIDVDDILKNRAPALKKISILDAGLYYDLIEGKEKDLAQELIDTWLHGKEEEIPDKEKEIITDLYARNKTKIHAIQMKFRNEALLEAGIPGKFLPGMRIPFRNHRSLILVLPLERKVLDRVVRYYLVRDNDIRKPKIILYGDLVGTEPLSDELKGGIKTAREQVNYFMNTRKIAMEKFSEQYCITGSGGRDLQEMSN